MAAVYARFKGTQGWEYQKVGRGRPPKDAKFHIRFTDSEGKRRWSEPYDTPQEAQANAAGVKVATQAAARGLSIEEFQNVTESGMTAIKTAVDKFLKLHRNDRPKTISQYTTALNHLVANVPSKIKFVNQLCTADQLDEYLQVLEKEDYAPKTVGTRMGVVFSMLKDYVQQTGVEFPSKLVSLPEPVQKRPKAYTSEDITKLFSVMDEEERVRYLFFLHTGCREQEVQFATWGDIDFKQRKFHVTGRDKEDVGFVPKNHEERWIPLTTELYELLKARKTESKTRWVFVNQDNEPDGHFLRKFKSIAKEAGLNCGHCKRMIMDGKYHLRKPTEVSCETRPVCDKHFLHRLRKTCATRWLRSGIDLMTIKAWLGHKSLAVTQIYLEDVQDINSDMQKKLDYAGAYKD